MVPKPKDPETRGGTPHEETHLAQLLIGWLRMEGVSKTFWKPHKLKDLDFLRRNYIQLFFSTPRNNIFLEISKKNRKIFKKKSKSEKLSKHKSEIFNENQYIFIEKFSIFCFRFFRFWFFVWFVFQKKSQIFPDVFFFFAIPQKYVFSELEKKVEHSFEAKNRDLSIYDVSRTFWALLRYVINPCRAMSPLVPTINKNNCYILNVLNSGQCRGFLNGNLVENRYCEKPRLYNYLQAYPSTCVVVKCIRYHPNHAKWLPEALLCKGV